MPPASAGEAPISAPPPSAGEAPASEAPAAAEAPATTTTARRQISQSSAVESPAKKARLDSVPVDLLTSVDQVLLARLGTEGGEAKAGQPHPALTADARPAGRKSREAYLGPPLSAALLDELSRHRGRHRMGDCYVQVSHGSSADNARSLKSEQFAKTYHRTTAIKPRRKRIGSSMKYHLKKSSFPTKRT